MGGKVSSFVSSVAKAGLKGATSYVLGTYIPFVGGHLANYINGRYGAGGMPDAKVSGVPPPLPSEFKPKQIGTAKDLIKLINEFPEEAKSNGITVPLVKEEMEKAKEQAKAIGGMLGGRSVSRPVIQPMPSEEPVSDRAYRKSNIEERPKLGKPTMRKGGVVTKEMMKQHAVGGEPKMKKARSPAQIEATKKLVEANKARRAGK
jgi:hypothetical protein